MCKRRFFPTLSSLTVFLLVLGLAACDSAAPDLASSLESGPSADAKPTILTFPSPQEPGPPYYANFFASPIFGDFIPTDDGMVGIAFVREPSCIPAGFNLLDWINPPTAFGCALTVDGKVWYDGVPTPGAVPYRIQMSGDDVPVYFVDRDELDGAMAGGLTIGELQGLSTLLTGTADQYRQVIHNSNHGAGFGHEVLTTSGTLEDGRRFQFRYNEQFDPATGERTFHPIRIQFH